MSIFMSVMVVAYAVIGCFTHIAMQKEYAKDTSTDLDEFSPVLFRCRFSQWQLSGRFWWV